MTTHSMRFRNMFDANARYVRLTYWGGSLNVWRVVEREDGTASDTLDVENVSDWRGLRHVNVPRESWSAVSGATALRACNEGLRLARVEHRNYLARTREARRDGTEDGRNAGAWCVDGNTSESEGAAILAAIEDGTYWDGWDVDYPQTYAADEERWDAYVNAYDTAMSEEIERAARALLGP